MKKLTTLKNKVFVLSHQANLIRNYPNPIIDDYHLDKIVFSNSSFLQKISKQEYLIRKILGNTDHECLISVYGDLKYIIENDEIDNEKFHHCYWDTLFDNYIKSDSKKPWEKKDVILNGNYFISDRNYCRYKLIFNREIFLVYYCMYWIYNRNIIIKCLLSEDTILQNFQKEEMVFRLKALYRNVLHIDDTEIKYRKAVSNAKEMGIRSGEQQTVRSQELKEKIKTAWLSLQHKPTRDQASLINRRYPEVTIQTIRRHLKVIRNEANSN